MHNNHIEVIPLRLTTIKLSRLSEIFVETYNCHHLEFSCSLDLNGMLYIQESEYIDAVQMGF